MLGESAEGKKEVLTQIKDKVRRQEEMVGDSIISAAMKVYPNKPHHLKDVHQVLRENKIPFAGVATEGELGEKLLEQLVEKEVQVNRQQTLERLNREEAQLKAFYAQLNRELSETKGSILDNPKAF